MTASVLAGSGPAGEAIEVEFVDSAITEPIADAVGSIFSVFGDGDGNRSDG